MTPVLVPAGHADTFRQIDATAQLRADGTLRSQ
jgi:hypothetical protein